MNSDHKIICSVCIANYNGADVIVPCIESVFGQDVDFPIEIIIHDDASTDSSVGIIRKHFPNITMIQSNENIGFSASNNRMAERAKGEYLLFLNNDAVLHRDALRILYLHSSTRDKPGILSLPQYNMQTRELIDMGMNLDMFMNPVPNRDRGIQNTAMVIGACTWIRKDLWDELGGFPEWFGNMAEDMYLCCVARLKGHPVTVLPSSGYDHWVGASFGGGKLIGNTMATTYRRRSLSERNKTFVMLLYYPSIIAVIIFPIHLLLLFLEGILLSLIKRETRPLKEIYLPCFTSLWRERKRLAGQRRVIQKGRRASLSSLLATHTFIPYKLSMLIRYGMPMIR